MKTCPACRSQNLPTNCYCQPCGCLLDSSPPIAVPSTVRWAETSGTLPFLKAALPAEVALKDLFGAKERVVLGRAPDCDICLPHPMVSRYHAILERHADGSLQLRDLASINGVWVAGVRHNDPVAVGPNQRVGIGPFLFTLVDGIIHTIDSSRSIRLEARHLEKVVSVGYGKTRKLLDDINMVVNPGEFVSLLGPSGSGKSTLMNALNGCRRATGGFVLANGEDFYRHFDNFRQSLGYVPQRDIVHTGLTVYKALYYTARLRLPTDTDPAELRARVEQVLQEMELAPARDTYIADLSGGQIKRVSLGAELLAQPCMLYIDEATSGLDAGTEARMMRLFRRLAEEGRSILCITHNVDNVEQCHLVIMLARGKLMFYGPPQEAIGYFSVKRISEIYDRLAEKDVTVWEKQYAESEFDQEYIARRAAQALRSDQTAHGLSVEDVNGAASDVFSPAPEKTFEEAGANESVVPPVSARERLAALLSDPFRLVALSQLPPLADHVRRLTARYLRMQALVSPVLESWHQFRVLLARYLELTFGDPRSLRLLLFQAPVIGLFLLLGFLDRPYRAPMPLLRVMKPNERAMLTSLEAISNALDDDQELDASLAVLEGTRFHISTGTGDGRRQHHEVSGKELLQLARDLKDPQRALDRQRDAAEFRIRGPNDQAIKITGRDLDEARKLFHQQEEFRRFLGLRVDQMSPAQKSVLSQVNVQVRVKDFADRSQVHSLNGVDLLTLLDQYDRMLEEWRRSHLDDIQVPLTIDGHEQPVVLTGKELVENLRTIHQAGVLDKLLGIDGPIVPVGTGVDPRYTYTVLFILVMIVLWFGCNNAAKEIVKEEAVFARERAVNLYIIPYVASKFLVLSFITAAQTVVLIVVLFGSMQMAHALWPAHFSFPFPSHMVSYPIMVGVLTLLSTAGVALGLLLSACVSTPDRANTLLPYVLIPQMILGGGFLAVRDGSLMYHVACLTSPVYWAYRAVHRGANDELLKTYPFYSTAMEGIGWPCFALVVQMGVLLVLTIWSLKRRDAS